MRSKAASLAVTLEGKELGSSMTKSEKKGPGADALGRSRVDAQLVRDQVGFDR